MAEKRLFIPNWLVQRRRAEEDLRREVSEIRKRLTCELQLRTDELSASLDVLRQQIRDEFAGEIHVLRHEIELLKSQAGDRTTEVERIDQTVRGLERVLRVTGQGSSDTPKQEGTQVGAGMSTKAATLGRAVEYLLLENRFRGSEADIRQRLARYVEIFDSRAPVLELGPGRGELQHLFREHQIPSYGIDVDEAMVRLCEQDGLDVRHEEIISHLEYLADRSLGGFIAIQVIEHLPLQILRRMFSLLGVKVRVGGKIVLETINTESIVALCRNYFRDPTHEWPMHPDTTKFQLEMSGLEVVEIRKLSAFPEAALFSRIEAEDFAPPRWRLMLERVNNNFLRLNELLFGHQDYCVIAQVPSSAALP